MCIINKTCNCDLVFNHSLTENDRIFKWFFRRSCIFQHWHPTAVFGFYGRGRFLKNSNHCRIRAKQSNLTLEGQMAFFKCKALLRRHVLISLKTFASKTKTMGSTFMKNIYIFNIYHHLKAVNESKSKVFKGKNPR